MTRFISRLIGLQLLLIAVLGGVVAWITLPQLAYAPRGIDWHWHWSYFQPFANGIQVTRTQDTKQLVLRRVYLNDALVVYLSTTIDNKFEIDVVKEGACEASAQQWVTAAVNNQSLSHIPMVCEKSGQSSIFRYVTPRPQTLEFGIDETFITEAFVDWPIKDIKVDQFQQQHPEFFKKQGAQVPHQWLRD